MIRHIVAWNDKEGFSDLENQANVLKIKAELESLPKIIESILEFRVYLKPLPSSGRTIILNSLFVSQEALVAYQIHPEHKRVAAFIGSVTQDRVCIDYEE